jgi:hypothetical protein
MKAIKPLLFAALAGLPLAVVPAMAQSTTSTTTTNGTTYSQSTQPGMAPSQPGTYKGAQTNPPVPQHPGAAASGDGGGAGSGK